MKHLEHGFHYAYNKAEVELMRLAGWVEHVLEPGSAPAEVAPEPEPELTPDRAALIASAEAAGVKIDRRWSTARIAEEVAKA